MADELARIDPWKLKPENFSSLPDYWEFYIYESDLSGLSLHQGIERHRQLKLLMHQLTKAGFSVKIDLLPSQHFEYCYRMTRNRPKPETLSDDVTIDI